MFSSNLLSTSLSQKPCKFSRKLGLGICQAPKASRLACRAGYASPRNLAASQQQATEDRDDLLSRLMLLRRKRSVAAKQEQYELALQIQEHLKALELDVPKEVSAALDHIDLLLSPDSGVRLAATRDLWAMPGYSELPPSVILAVHNSFMRGSCMWHWSRDEAEQISNLTHLMWRDPELCDERWLSSVRHALTQSAPTVRRAMAELVAARGQQVKDSILIRKTLKSAQAQSVWELEQGRKQKLGELSEKMNGLRSSYKGVFAAGSAVMMAAVALPTVQELHPEPEELQLLYGVLGSYLAGVMGAYCHCLRRALQLVRAHDAVMNYEGVLGGGDEGLGKAEDGREQKACGAREGKQE